MVKPNDDELHITPSADDILDVSPVNTFEANGAAVSRVMNEDAFSSSSSEDYEDVEIGQDDSSADSSGGRHGFEDLDSGKPPSGRSGYTPSPFDEALTRGGGKPSRGQVAPSFFSAQHQQVPQPAGTNSAAGENTSDSESRTTLSSDSSSIVKSAGSKPPSYPPPPPKPPTLSNQSSNVSISASTSTGGNPSASSRPAPTSSSVAGRPNQADQQQELSSGVLPDVLMTMRQKIESLTLFDSDMMKLADDPEDTDPILVETRESLKRSSQQSISAAVLVSLAHKRYERRRLAAMEIEKVVRSLVQQNELERVRAILLLLSDDYVRSTSEDARKGGVVALAASAIGLKKVDDDNPVAQECRDLILASVVHACQDHSQRVRYYATESLFNVVKVIPVLCVQHFFILFEILRSLYADVDVDVRSGAELLDKKLKEVIIAAINSGNYTADSMVPVFARFVYMRNKATKRLTLTWLQELNEKLIGSPILEFLHLFLGGIFDMVADPTLAIRQSALAFLQSVLPKLLVVNSEAAIEDMESGGMKVDFDKILQSLVTTMEHPDPFVRKVAMYWIFRVIKSHIGKELKETKARAGREQEDRETKLDDSPAHSAATISVRNSLPHILPSILLSIGDTFHTKATTKDSFLPDQTTHALAEQTNSCLQEAVRRNGKAYVTHLHGFIMALREELDSPGGLASRNPPAVEHKPYRMDVKHDGTGIESQGWFRASKDTKEENIDSMSMSRLCALHWVIVLYESVVPDVLKADYAKEFVIHIIHQLVDNPPEDIVFKSLEVLAKITVPVDGETHYARHGRSLSGITASSPPWASSVQSDDEEAMLPMTDLNIDFALDILPIARRKLKSRNREVFSALIQVHSHNHHLLADLSKVIAYMCRLQPPEFIFVSFAVELDRFVRRKVKLHEEKDKEQPLSRELEFVSAFVQQMSHVLMNAKEASDLREALKDCIGNEEDSERGRRRSRLFHILLTTFSHNLVSTTALCIWSGAFRTASLYLRNINPLDIHLMFLLEVDKLVELIERPLFRHLHVRMLECDPNPTAEGSGTMLFQTLKYLLMLIPQSTCYNILRDRLISTSRFRQTVIPPARIDLGISLSKETEAFVSRILDVRELHCDAMWQTIRADSLESAHVPTDPPGRGEEGTSERHEWLGYSSKTEEETSRAKFQEDKRRLQSGFSIEEIRPGYNDFESMVTDGDVKNYLPNGDENESWKDYWAQSETKQ